MVHFRYNTQSHDVTALLSHISYSAYRKREGDELMWLTSSNVNYQHRRLKSQQQREFRERIFKKAIAGGHCLCDEERNKEAFVHLNFM